jgi:hypothetical protein
MHDKSFSAIVLRGNAAALVTKRASSEIMARE